MTAMRSPLPSQVSLLSLIGADRHRGAEAGFRLLLNPTDIFRLANLAGFEAARAYTGMAAVATGPLFHPGVLLGMLVLWVSLPLSFAVWRFNRRRV